jgi:hypothetical protein
MSSTIPATNPIRTVFADRRFWLGTPGRVLLLLVVVNVFVARYERQLDQARRENLLAVAPQVAASGSDASAVPRFDQSVGESLDVYLRYMPDARTNRVVVLSGMSQMYAINEQKRGDQTISEWMDDFLAPRGTRVFGLAAANLDNEEALLLLLATLDSPATTPKAFIYALCFDKMRFVELRPSYLELIRRTPALRRLLADAARDHEKQLPLAAAEIRNTLASIDSSAIATGDSTGLERRLRNDVAEVVPLVHARKLLNNFLMINVLYEARNKILGIKNTSKRPIIQGRYNVNRELLLLMIDVAAKHGVRFIMYINPLNPQADNPYVPAEYAAFKIWAKQTADSLGVPFANLENEVPKDDWGLFLGGPDFKHFKGAGHRKTAEAVVREFGDILAPSPSRNGASQP